MKKITGNDEVELFTRFADKYCNKIEDSYTAEYFFKDFLTETGGCVNIDCLDEISFEFFKKLFKILSKK